MFVAYRMSNGIEYAALVESVRSNGKIDKSGYRNLGRVLDKSRGIYRNKDRGVYTYNAVTNEFGPAPADFIEPQRKKRAKYVSVNGKKVSRLSLDFGDSYLLDQFIRRKNLYDVIDSIDYSNKDTIHALLFYYVLSTQANSHAETWYELSYTRILFPKATLASQRISDALSLIGTEEVKRGFFSAYYAYVQNRTDGTPEKDCGLGKGKKNGEGILIDSTGVPNDAHLPITATNNHNGIISNEVRLIYVVQQKTGLPLFFRYAAGNVIDPNTIVRTVEELKANHIDTKFALLDAGYYNQKNADVLINAGISFVSRMHRSDRGLYAQILKEHLGSLECRENFTIYNSRFYYIKTIKVKIGEKKDHDAYAYLCLDETHRQIEVNMIKSHIMDENLKDGEVYDDMQHSGLFILIATRKIAKENILTLYGTRNEIEDIFKVGKNYGKLLPMQVESEQALQGHLLMTFMAVVIWKLLSDDLKDTGFTTEDVFQTMRHLQVLVYDDKLITSEPVKKMNEILRHLKMECPAVIPTSSKVDVAH